MNISKLFVLSWIPVECKIWQTHKHRKNAEKHGDLLGNEKDNKLVKETSQTNWTYHKLITEPNFIICKDLELQKVFTDVVFPSKFDRLIDRIGIQTCRILPIVWRFFAVEIIQIWKILTYEFMCITFFCSNYQTSLA